MSLWLVVVRIFKIKKDVLKILKLKIVLTVDWSSAAEDEEGPVWGPVCPSPV